MCNNAPEVTLKIYALPERNKVGLSYSYEAPTIAELPDIATE